MQVKNRLSKEVEEYCKKYKIEIPEDISVLVKSSEEAQKGVPVLVTKLKLIWSVTRNSLRAERQKPRASLKRGVLF